MLRLDVEMTTPKRRLLEALLWSSLACRRQQVCVSYARDRCMPCDLMKQLQSTGLTETMPNIMYLGHQGISCISESQVSNEGSASCLPGMFTSLQQANLPSKMTRVHQRQPSMQSTRTWSRVRLFKSRTVARLAVLLLIQSSLPAKVCGSKGLLDGQMALP